MSEIDNCFGQAYRYTLTNPTQGSLVMQGDPVGWEETDEILRRDERLHGIFWDYTLKLEFYCGNGKEFIDTVFENEGIDGEITILIEKNCTCENDFEEYLTGKINLSSIEQEGNLSRVNIEGEGIQKLVKNRLDTKVNLNSLVGLDGQALEEMEFAGYELNLHSKLIVIKSKMIIEDGPIESERSAKNFFGSVFPVEAVIIQVPFTNISYDDLQGLSVPSTPLIKYYSLLSSSLEGGGYEPLHLNFSTVDYEPTATYLNDSVEKTVTINYDFDGTITEVNDNPGPQNYTITVLYRVGSVFAVATDYVLYTVNNVSLGASNIGSFPMVIDGTSEVVIPADQYLWVYIKLTGFNINSGKTITVTQSFTNASIELINNSSTEGTPAKAYGIFEAFDRVSHSISGQSSSFRSEYFGRKNSSYPYDSNGCGSFNAISNGALIRGFPLDDTTIESPYPLPEQLVESGRPVFISMNDLYEGANAIFNLGFGVEKLEGNTWAVVVEPKSYFYDPTVLIQIPSIPNLKISSANGYYYNKVTVGYEKWENEQVNGLDEFNSKREYSLPIKSIKNELTILSKFIASGYAIEFTRRKRYDQFRTEDYKYDNDNFIIALNRTTNGSGEPANLDDAEKDENFPDTNNLISPETAYNLRLSPARNFLRWNSVVNTGMLKKPGEYHKFTYGEANYKMESKMSDACPGDYNDALLSESQDIQWDGDNNNDSTPIWIPLIGNFEYPLTDMEWQTIKANPKGQLEISETETDFIKAYILEIRRKQNGMASFKVIFANDEFTNDCLMDYIDSEYIDCDYIE